MTEGRERGETVGREGITCREARTVIVKPRIAFLLRLILLRILFTILHIRAKYLLGYFTCVAWTWWSMTSCA